MKIQDQTGQQAIFMLIRNFDCFISDRSSMDLLTSAVASYLLLRVSQTWVWIAATSTIEPKVDLAYWNWHLIVLY